MPGHRSLAELVAELEDPQPTDIDPEAIERTQQVSSSNEESDSEANREHYEVVGKSKLREALQPALGPEYIGSSISRKDLYKDDEEDNPFSRKPGSESDDYSQDDEEYDDPDQVDLNFQDEEDEDIDSDDAFGDGEEEVFRKKGFTFRDSEKSSRSHKLGLKASPERAREENEDDSAGSSDAEFSALDSNVSEDDPEHPETEATTDTESDSVFDEALRATVLDEQKQVVTSLSRGIDNEVKKGQSIQKQYTAFDTLVGVRIHLQKSLATANSINAAEQTGDRDRLAESAKAAESAALGLLNSMTSLLHSMQSVAPAHQPKSILGKRPFSATITTSSEDISQALAASHKAFKSHRRHVLADWENKTQGVTLSKKNRVVDMETDGQDESLVTRLDRLLLRANQDRLIEKTRIARSCAPQTTESEKNGTGDTTLPVYDDADFYTLLLRELIEHKKTFTRTRNTDIPNGETVQNLNPNSMLHTNKSKRANVDTKASKGRKMKYVVHEKLQNFMAPVNLGTWEVRQAEELFASLLGQKIARLDEEQENQAIEEGEDMEMQGLRLFGGA